VIAAAAVLAVVVGFAEKASQEPSPVPAPSGLIAASSTTSTVQLRWSPPAAGQVPDRYIVAVDGEATASVPGTVTSYQARGLAPATTYQLRVRAVRGGQRSPWSRALAAATRIPSTSAAVLSGAWIVRQKVVRSSVHEQTFLLGKTWTNGWQFSPQCAPGPCAVTLAGNIYGSSPFTTTLTRSGPAYTGTIRMSNFGYCGYRQFGTTYPLHTVIDFRITVSRAATIGRTWAASAWAGTMTIHYSYPQDPSFCPSWSWKASLRGIR